MDTLLGLLAFPVLLGVPLLYAYLQGRLLRRWTGGWRLVAGLPLLGWATWVGKFARDVTLDPTSHNLFPFEVLIGTCAAMAYLGCSALEPIRKVCTVDQGVAILRVSRRVAAK
jgi:hypothetical protein